MDPGVFNQFRELVYREAGIALGPGKQALVSARVGRRMRALGITDHGHYLQHVMEDASGKELVHLLDALSTNFTSFFRETAHFAFLEDVLSRWLAAGQRRFRIWSAACSTGEEPYSLAMTVLDMVRGREVDAKILATDISTRALATAADGSYAADRLKGVPDRLRQRYFDAQRNGGTTIYRVKRDVRDLVVLKRLNLSEPPFPMRGPMDLVFCRNVMIYFDNRVRRLLLDEVHRLLKDTGYLIVGHAESLTGMVSQFKPLGPSIYTKK